ncbi:unnamed protein product, partial [Rotaria sp. Silwood2]
LDLLKRLPTMAQHVLQRFQNLLQNQTNTGIIENNDKIFLNNLNKLIINDLTDLIKQFEIKYSHEEEEKQQENTLHNNSSTKQIHIQSFVISNPIDELRNNIENVTETKISRISSERSFNDYEYVPHIYDDNDDDEIAHKKKKFHKIFYTDYQLEDDGYGTRGATTN